MTEAISLFTDIVREAIPYGMAFALGQIIVNMFMKMAFKGKIEIGG